MQQRRRGSDEGGWGARGWVLAAASALLAACAVEGGQSGTDEPSYPPCSVVRTEQVPLTEQLEGLGVSAAEVVVRLQTIANLPGVWFARQQRATLSLAPVGAARATYSSRENEGGALCWWSLELSVPLRVQSSDGVVDAEVPATVRAGAEGWLLVGAQLPELSEQSWQSDDPRALALERQRWGLPEGGGVMLGASLPVAEDGGATDVGILRDDDVVGFFTDDPNSAWVTPEPPKYVPPAPLSASCADAESRAIAAAGAPLSDVGSAQRELSRAWARCVDTTESDHVGLLLRPDGSYAQLGLSEGQLVALRGFGREGTVSFSDAGMGDQAQVSLRLLPNGVMAPAVRGALIFPASRGDWPDTIYLPTDLPFRDEAPVSSYAAGERAGVTACAAEEQGRLTAADEVRVALSGAYTLCAGELPGGVLGLRFSANQVELLGVAGAVLERHEYYFDDMLSPDLGLVLGGGARYWRIELSTRPVKLRVAEGENQAVLSAEP